MKSSNSHSHSEREILFRSDQGDTGSRHLAAPGRPAGRCRSKDGPSQTPPRDNPEIGAKTRAIADRRHRFRIRVVNDNCCRKNLCLMTDTSIQVARVARGRDALVQLFDRAASVASDNGAEFNSRAILKSANDRCVARHYIDPRNPQQNAFVESFRDRLRDGLLNEEASDSPGDVRYR